jgi:photosystem II stability/assembly factor-like uncharacterized protein
VGAEGTFMETQDGGRQWKAADAGTDLHILGLCPAGEDLFLVGRDGLILSRRGGQDSFQPLKSGLYTWLTAVAFLDPRLGFVAGGRGYLLKTTDAGRSWQRLSGR